MLMDTQTLVMDLDDTICFTNHEGKTTETKYGIDHAQPAVEMITSLQKAKKQGYRIVIHTARRMLTHGGDINKIIEDVGPLTEKWLKHYEVPYDEIVWGKPYGVYYVDDKAMRPEEFIKFMEWN